MPKGKRNKQSSEEWLATAEARALSVEARKIVDEKKTSMTMPARTEQRICFGIMWFTSQEDAAVAHRAVRDQGRTVNGGFFDGMACGRAPEWDYVEDGIKYFAVTN